MIGERPASVPAEWVIFNASRPIYGDIEWRDGGGFGFFWTAVDPAGQRAAWMQEENRRNDAAIVTLVTEEEAYQRGRQIVLDRYGYTADVLQTVDDPSNRNWMVNSYIDSVNER